MKQLFLFFFFLFTLITASAQNDMKARLEYEEAEALYAKESFEEALQHLNKAETLLGQWSPRIGYLKILVLDKQVDYAKASPELKELQKQVKAYMGYSEKAGDKLDPDKFKAVYAVEQKLDALKQQETWKSMPEYTAGNEAFGQKNYTAAVESFQKAAAKGNALAMNDLASLYSRGLGVSQSSEESVKWLHKAADKGLPGAFFRIGLAHTSGKGAQKSDEEALKWFRKAAERGDVDGMEVTGYYIANGWGAKKDYTEGLQWSLKAAERGSANAMYDIGEIYRKNWTDMPNHAEGFRWYEKAAEKGHEKAMLYIGTMYVQESFTKSWEVRHDCEKGVAWLQKAAEKGNAKAYGEIGNLYYFGNCVTKDYKAALPWFFKALEKGDEEVATRIELIASSYELGINDVKKDKKYAAELRAKLKNR